jgi:hypothetical protein
MSGTSLSCGKRVHSHKTPRSVPLSSFLFPLLVFGVPLTARKHNIANVA